MKELKTLELWAAIASSLAAIVSLALFGYQLWTDRPDLRLSLKGVASADFPRESKLYFAIWIEAFNRGKRPVGIMESKLEIVSPGKGPVLLDEVPAFPRYQTDSGTGNLPAVEQPFFYKPDYYDSAVRNKNGSEQPFDYHPKCLQREIPMLDTGGYRRGFVIFRIDKERRNGFLLNPNLNKLSLVLYTTEDERRLSVVEINKWKQETFGSRFFIVEAHSDQPAESGEASVRN